MDKPLFSQTFVGAVLVAVLGALIAWFFTAGQVVRVEVINAGAIPASTQPRPSEPNRSGENVPATAPETAPLNADQLPRIDKTCLEAVIQDADRYTNIRSGPSTNFDVIARVLEGEVFCVTSQRGRWWTIRTASGASGYIYHDRVRVITRD